MATINFTPEAQPPAQTSPLLTSGQVVGQVGDKISFYGGTPISKPTVSGAWAGNAAGKALCVALAAANLITDNTTA